MQLSPQTPAWYDRLATMQEGYYYPWRSTLGAMNGEREYLALVHDHLTPQADLLDAACGHGAIALELARYCRTVFGYDRTAAWIDRAQRTAQARGITNATFRCYDSSAAANGGRPHIPAPDGSFDLLVCRKGPFHWIEDAPRVARPGAVLLMLVPDSTPLTPWHEWLPEPLRWRPADDPHWARPAIERRLAVAGLALHSWWSFDVPEWFADAEQLYRWLTFGMAEDEAPSFEQTRPLLARVFAEYGTPEGVEVRRRHYLWKAVVPR